MRSKMSFMNSNREKMKYLVQLIFALYCLVFSVLVAHATIPVSQFNSSHFQGMDEQYKSEPAIDASDVYTESDLKDELSENPDQDKHIDKDFPETFEATTNTTTNTTINSRKERVYVPAVPRPIRFNFLSVFSNRYFADCTENVVHNIINLLAYNRKTGLFDIEQLKKLRDLYYPNMSEKMLQYYSFRKRFSQHNTRKAGHRWLDVIANLNKGLDLPKNDRISYHIYYNKTGFEEEMFAGHTNIIKAVNRLLGSRHDLSKDNMQEIFDRLSSIQGLQIKYRKWTEKSRTFSVARFFGPYKEIGQFQIGNVIFQIESWGKKHALFKRVR
ncbi:MAG: hypothetical protein HQK51_01615 [Oligoflexia bacterium]|nr:hypothetical protein [Oligoflexia bacterium]